MITLLHRGIALCTCLFIICTLTLTAQVELEVIIDAGDASSTCNDDIPPIEHVWSVNIAGQGWVNFTPEDFCASFAELPNFIFADTVLCPSEVMTDFPIQFRAFENDPGLGNPCNTINPDVCYGELTQTFNFPAPGNTEIYTMTLPTGGDIEGFVRFRIRSMGQFIGGFNDLPCDAIDLGILNAGMAIGDANRSIFNNYCGTFTPGEPNPADVSAGWQNEAGVWYKFRTGDSPGDRIQIIANSDPDEIGDPLFLQIGLYEVASRDCSGEFSYLGGSGSRSMDSSLDERLDFTCHEPLRPNTNYYLLVDGVADSEDDLFGVFGMEVRALTYAPTIIDTTLCANESISMLGNSYTESGQYTDQKDIGFGCDSTVILNLTVLPLLTATYTQTAIAVGEGGANGSLIINPEGGSGNYAILWSDGGTGAARSDLIGGEMYVVQVVDEIGCTFELMIAIDFIPLMMAQMDGDTLACFGDQNGQLSIEIEGGMPPYNYSWQSQTNASLAGEGRIQTADEPIQLINLSAGVYSITISDQISPDVVLTGVIEQPDELVVEVAVDQSISCYAACDGRLLVSANGGMLPYQFEFSGRNVMNGTTALFSDLCEGTYTALITDANGCQVEMQTTIDAPEELMIHTLDLKNVTCFGGSDGRISLESNGIGMQYQWSNMAEGAVMDNLVAGNYEVLATDENGCELRETFEITQPLIPLEASIQVTQKISCADGTDGSLSVTIEGAQGTTQFEWSNGSSAEQLTQLAAGTYTLTITDEKGCTVTTEQQLTQPEPLSFNIETKDISCLDADDAGAIVIQNMTGGQPPYRTSLDGILFSDRPQLVKLFAGTYEVILQDANGCELSQSATIAGPPEIVVTLGVDQTIELGESIELTALTTSTAPIFQWQSEDSLSCMDCATQLLRPMQNTIYLVEVTDAITQCRASASLQIFVDDTRKLYIPNVFSPNNDGKNDYFTVYGSEMIEVIKSMRIFDRYGAIMFEAFDFRPDDELKGWNGRFSEQKVAAAVYAYFLEITFINGETLMYTGDVSLVR
ncbi:MAG: gliding motility-associated C-terminal domain-containing protein [Bacteroidota bacterium]